MQLSFLQRDDEYDSAHHGGYHGSQQYQRCYAENDEYGRGHHVKKRQCNEIHGVPPLCCLPSGLRVIAAARARVSPIVRSDSGILDGLRGLMGQASFLVAGGQQHAQRAPQGRPPAFGQKRRRHERQQQNFDGQGQKEAVDHGQRGDGGGCRAGEGRHPRMQRLPGKGRRDAEDEQAHESVVQQKELDVDFAHVRPSPRFTGTVYHIHRAQNVEAKARKPPKDGG